MIWQSLAPTCCPCGKSRLFCCWRSTEPIYIFLAIVSYSPDDPAWSFAGTDLAVSNLVGQSGAFAADVILFLFGRISYLLPLALAIAGVKVLRPAEETWTLPLFSIPLLRLAGRGCVGVRPRASARCADDSAAGWSGGHRRRGPDFPGIAGTGLGRSHVDSRRDPADRSAGRARVFLGRRR